MKNSFSSKIGVQLAAAGSAVGLGSIWKFPYTVGENGGGAFIILYVICSLLFGLPLVMNEFMIGKRSGKSAYGAFRTLSGTSQWQWLAWTTILTVTLIMSFYFVLTGWCFYYLVQAASNTFGGMDAAALTAHFKNFEGQAPQMIFYATVAILLTASVLWFDVNKGIERLSKILMPLLLLMLIAMAVRMILLDSDGAGLQYLFMPDFSKMTSTVVLKAMGLSFFTLSVGMSILVTYGAYMPEGQNVPATSLQMILLVICVSLLAGMVIFPAVFAYGFSPAEGPELTFVTLPAVFQNMLSPTLSSVTFFTLMCVAAITSTISLMEVMVAFTCEATSSTRKPLNRHQSAVLIAVLQIITNTLCILSLTGEAEWLKVNGQNLFDAFNAVTTDILIPIGALGMSLFTGWFVPKARYEGSPVASFIFLVILRWVVPIAIAIIFLDALHLL